MVAQPTTSATGPHPKEKPAPLGERCAIVLAPNTPENRAGEADDHLIALLSAVRAKQAQVAAGVPDGVGVDLSLVKLPEDALMLQSFSLVLPRNPRALTKEFMRKAAKL